MIIIMSKICIYTIFLLALISCRKSQHDSVLAVLKEWEQREILFPSCPVFTIQGKDTVDYKYQGIYKIVSYVDSSGCTSCKLHLHDWAKLIDEFDSIYPNTVQFLFYFSPRKKEEIRRTLLLNKFYYPICIDEQDSINILNNFPSDFNFQTFLLDADNKIIAVGNPVYNIKIKELYTKIISGEERILSLKYGEELQTSVALDRDFINIGTFDWEQEQIVELRVSNIGKNFFVVNSISTSCGCITVEYPKEPIQPGGVMVIKVKYNADHPEHFNKTITIYCNANDAPFRLSVSGNAK